MNKHLVLKAEVFATKAHEGQTEKDEQKTPYIFHPKKVAEMVEISGGSVEEIAAAWLHDVVEDTDVTIETIRNEFGEEVAHIVEGLTDLPEYTQLATAERKQKQADRVLTESDSVRRVKLADQISAVELDSKNGLLDKDDRKRYIDGCKKIAENCKGISEFLDKKFNETYDEAVRFLAQ